MLWNAGNSCNHASRNSKLSEAVAASFMLYGSDAFANEKPTPIGLYHHSQWHIHRRTHLMSLSIADSASFSLLSSPSQCACLLPKTRYVCAGGGVSHTHLYVQHVGKQIPAQRVQLQHATLRDRMRMTKRTTGRVPLRTGRGRTGPCSVNKPIRLEQPGPPLNHTTSCAVVSRTASSTRAASHLLVHATAL